MNSEYKYFIYAYDSEETWEDGHLYETVADTIKEAKEKAKYSLSEAFRISGEMSARFGYARVLNRKGECVYDCFSKFGVVQA